MRKDILLHLANASLAEVNKYRCKWQLDQSTNCQLVDHSSFNLTGLKYIHCPLTHVSMEYIVQHAD